MTALDTKSRASAKRSENSDGTGLSALKMVPLATLAASQLFFTSCSKEAPMTARAELPTTFTAQAKYISLGTNMTLSDNQGPFASIEQRLLNMTPTFQYFDSSHTLNAQAKQKLLSLGTKIEISDGNGQTIGSVEENVLKSFFSIKTSYSIKDANGREVASSEKLDWAGTKVTINDPSGKMLVNMTRPMWDLGGATWTVNVEQDLPFDKRLVVFIPSFKTAADKVRSDESSSKSGSSKK